jgi:murein DD-endopeptidase MepM/ murein hydrolase activator NlpD
MLVDHELHFFPDSESAPQGYGSLVALQGVHALLDPGPYPLRLEATLPDGSKQSFEQSVLVLSGNYNQENILINDPATIDPVVTVPEEEHVREIVAAATPQRFWEGIFQSPAVYQEYTSFYGNRRTYIVQNSESTIQGFHTGLDFAGGEGLQIKSPAPGKVVFAGPLTVRGNATIIDHGWGVYSGFWHQSKIDVQVGDVVETGQVIGLVGGTGRVTGAHLHWEVWVNGVQVNPFDWLQREYP